MSDSLAVAVVAASIALIVAFINSIVAEWFRRRQDRKALAAGIAGELASYEPAWPLIRERLNSTIASIDAGNRRDVSYRPFEKPRDYVFEKAVEKLGLLGPALVEDVVYVYGNINAFRVSFAMLSSGVSEMSDSEMRARCCACIDSLDRAVKKGIPLISALKCVARSKC